MSTELGSWLVSMIGVVVKSTSPEQVQARENSTEACMNLICAASETEKMARMAMILI
jgi:hypothetical protein